MRRRHLVMLIVPCLFVGGRAWARDRPTATFYMDMRSKVYVRTVVEALERAISRLPQLDFKPVRYLLEPVAPQLEKVARAQAQIREGQRLMNNLEVQQAVQAYQQAVRLRRQTVHLTATPDGIQAYARLLVDLAVGQFLAGDEPAARGTLQQAFVLLPGLEYDKRAHPPQTRRMFNETRFLVDELGTGAAHIDTAPTGAQVWINGSFVGFSPVLARGVTAGPNLVTLARAGYRTRTTTLQVAGGSAIDRVTLPLRPLAGDPRSLLESAVQEATSGRPGPSLAALTRQLGRRFLLLATSNSRDDVVTVNLVAYDAKHHRISSGTRTTVSALDPDRESQVLLDGLLPFLTWRRPPVVSKRPAPTGWWNQFRASPYFWPAVGAAAAVVVTSVSLGVYYGTRDDNDNRRNILLLPAVGRYP